GSAPLPTPVEVTLEELLSGHGHYERVATSGIVRSVDQRENLSVLILSAGNGRLEAHVPGHLEAEQFVDAVVHVSGLAAGSINDKRQLVVPHLRVRSPADLTVRVPPPVDPFGMEPISADDLLQFSPQ